MAVLRLLVGRFEEKSSREIICKLPRAPSSQQIKNPLRESRAIRLKIIRGDGSKPGVGVYRDARRGATPKKRQERGRRRTEQGDAGEGKGGEECCWRRCLAVARTRARSVVMSAGGQAADYYHCMNMNETRRRRWRRRRRTGNGDGGRTSVEKDVHIRPRSDPTENVASGGEGENLGGRPCDRGKGRRSAREKLSGRRAKGRKGAREEAARGESAKGAAFN